MRSAALKYLEPVSTYLPLVAAAVLLLLGSFVDQVFSVIPLGVLLAVMATSFLLAVVHLETTLLRAVEDIGTMSRHVQSLATAQSDYLSSWNPQIRHMSLAAGFQQMNLLYPRAEHLRIYAISSAEILSFFRYYNFRVERCSLLVRGFHPDDEEHREYAASVKLLIRDWRALERLGRIGTLTVRSYDFLPTEYECIFDSSAMLLGLYESDPTDYSGVKVRGVTFLDSSSKDSKQIIDEYVERFDRFFEVCAAHHGPDIYADV